MTHEQIAAFRLSRQQLAGRPRATIEAICRAVCGIQAQVMSSAELELWTRNRAIRRADVAAALWTRRSLVKTSAMRQTLHLLAAHDLPLYISALKRSRSAAAARLLSRLKVTPEEAAQMQRTILEALADGPATQQALVQHAQKKASKHLRAWLKFAWSAFRPSIVEGLICYGPPRGSEVTLVRTDLWLGKQPAVAEDDAKRELLRRFLGAYGPGTVRDFVKWSGIPMSEAKPVWDTVSAEMTGVTIDPPLPGARHVPGTDRARRRPKIANRETGNADDRVGARHVPGTAGRAWILKRDMPALKAAVADPEAVRLLPAFDVYLLAHSAKDHLVEPTFYKRVYRNQGWLSPVVLRGGRIIGVWFLRSTAGSQIVDVEPFAPLTRAVKTRIEEEVGALSEFLNAPCRVLFGRD